MAHITQKKLREREKNNKLRVKNGFNTGTRDMGKIKRQILDDMKKKELKEY